MLRGKGESTQDEGGRRMRGAGVEGHLKQKEQNILPPRGVKKPVGRTASSERLRRREPLNGKR